jgi:succinyl-diaminopimelate desuccinylase
MTLPNPVALTQELVRMNTVNPPGNEDRCVQLLAELLSGAGFSCRTHEFAPRRTSLVARIGGAASGKAARAPLCFTGHVDVVPLGGAAWQHDPFGANIVDGRLYGRGSSDMKSGIAAFVTAAMSRADSLHDGPGVSLIITAGEETGCEGAFAMASSPEARELLGSAGALVVAEPTSNLPLLGHKGAFWVTAQAAGTTAHGSMPERGDNAVYKMARAALALENFEFETGAHALMGFPTLNVGTARGGLNINSVPDSAELGIDIRTVAGQDHAQVLRCLCNVLGPHIGLRTLLDVNSVYTEPDDAWMKKVFAICKHRNGLEPEHRTVSYFTDASALRAPLGMPPVVILGPGVPGLAHQTDEYCRVDRIGEATVLFADLIDDWQSVKT